MQKAAILSLLFVVVLVVVAVMASCAQGKYEVDEAIPREAAFVVRFRIKGPRLKEGFYAVLPISTRITQLLGISHPILLAPMDLVADAG
jgi:hypothetical protein